MVFISGNMPMRTEITPLLIMTKLEQYDYAGATAIAVVMLVTSFVLLLAINLLQRWTRSGGDDRGGSRPLCVRDGNPCDTAHAGSAPPRRSTESAARTRLLIAVASSFWPLFLFAAARGRLRRGVRARCAAAYFTAFTDPDTLAAIQADPARRRHCRPAQPRIRRGRGLGDRKVRVSRQEPARSR